MKEWPGDWARKYRISRGEPEDDPVRSGLEAGVVVRNFVTGGDEQRKDCGVTGSLAPKGDDDHAHRIVSTADRETADDHAVLQGKDPHTSVLGRRLRGDSGGPIRGPCLVRDDLS